MTSKERRILQKARQLVASADIAVAKLRAALATARLNGHTLRERSLVQELVNAELALDIAHNRYIQIAARIGAEQ